MRQQAIDSKDDSRGCPSLVRRKKTVHSRIRTARLSAGKQGRAEPHNLGDVPARKSRASISRFCEIPSENAARRSRSPSDAGKIALRPVSVRWRAILERRRVADLNGGLQTLEASARRREVCAGKANRSPLGRLEAAMDASAAIDGGRHGVLAR